jgi:putative ABC transport system permease protein
VAWLRSALGRVRRLLPGGRERLRDDIREEIEEHVARLTEDNVARGLAPERARVAAEHRFGNPDAIAERCQDERPTFRLEELVADLRYGARLLLRSPGFAIAAILTLALGIGANSAVFSLVHGVLLQRLPFHDPDRLMTARGFSIPDFEDFRRSTLSFDATALWASNLYTVVSEGAAEQIPGIVAEPELLQLLGQPALGRVFRPEETDQPLAVISHELWRSRFGGSEDVLGRTLQLGATTHVIVGVMPPGFHFPSEQYKFWVTFGSAFGSAPEQKANRSLRIFGVVARLRPGMAPAAVSRELEAFSQRQAQAHPDTNREVSFAFRPIHQSMVGGVRQALLILLAAVGLVLLITCANVANLLLARTASRQRELALRAALGASRRRIVRQLLAESLLLAGIGGALGLGLAVAGLRWLQSWPGANLPRLASVRVDLDVLLFTFALSVATGVVFGILPALRAAGAGPMAALKEGGRTTAKAGQKLRSTLVAVEVGLAVMVTVGAALLVRSFLALTSADPGFSEERLITGTSVLVDVPPERRPQVVASILEQIASVPGVEIAGAGTGHPPETPQRVTRYELPGVETKEPLYAYFLSVTPSYLPALEARLVRGRHFGPEDTASSAPVVIVSERLARVHFGDRDPVGQRLRIVNRGQPSDFRDIIGVVGDVRYSGMDDVEGRAIYTPYPQNPQLLGGVYLMVRARSEGASTLEGIGRAVRAAAPGLYAVNLRPMRDVVSGTVSSPRLNASLLSLFSALALVLSAIGIYGLISYSVSQRMHEIGLRIALGAGRSDVTVLVLRHAMGIVGAGLASGLVASLLASRVLRNLLFEVQPADPTTFALVSLLFLGIGLLAGYVPVRRATQIDPVNALRYE